MTKTATSTFASSTNIRSSDQDPPKKTKAATRHGWIGVDLDGTLATYSGWRGISHIGDPVPLMIARVKALLQNGFEVRVMTARVCREDEREEVVRHIHDWTERHIGARLPVTNQKDFGMIALYDDRAIAVEENTGLVLGGNDIAKDAG